MDELTKLVLQEHETPTQSKDTILQQFFIHTYYTKEDTVLKQLAAHKMIWVLPTVVSPKKLPRHRYRLLTERIFQRYLDSRKMENWS
jgi:hypothetical protein